MTAEVAQSPQTDLYKHRSQTPDSIDRELDWMISNEGGQRNLTPDASETYSNENEHHSSSASPVTAEAKDHRTPSPAPSGSSDTDRTDNKHLQSESNRTLDTPSPQDRTDHNKSSDKSPQGSPNGSPHSSPQASPKGSPHSSPQASPNGSPHSSPQASPKGSPHSSPQASPKGSPVGSPKGSPPESPREQSRQQSDDDDLHMTEDQQQANAELNTMKLDLGYTADEEPPDYDVAEKVRQLNEELANEPSPDEDRKRSIQFKDNLVDLVAPPPPDMGTDDEGTDDQSKENPADSEDDTTPRVTSDGESDTATPRSRDEDKVLVERNGKFELLSADELSPEERALYCVPEPDNGDSNNHKPQPPNKPRPQTANGSSSQSSNEGNPRRRVQSAKPTSTSEWEEEFTYKSPYAMTPEHRKELAKKKREEDKQKREEEEQKKKEEEHKSEENNSAFTSWLRKKRERQSNNRNEEQDQKEEEEEEEDSDANKQSYEDWLKAKKEQHKKSKQQEKKQQEEINEGWYVRPRKDCDKAFREWLKKKNAETKKQQSEDKQRSRIHKLLARRSRKSQQLARAIKQAQAYRYVDYYGYRF